MKTYLKLCVVALFVLCSSCAWWQAKGPAITDDGFKEMECVASHYQDLAHADNVENVAVIVAEDCGVETSKLVLDIFGGLRRGLKRAGVKIEE